MGVILKVDPAAGEPEGTPEHLYLTLEKGFDMGGNERTVLCGWEGDSHVNFGDGPPATQADFIKAIEGKL